MFVHQVQVPDLENAVKMNQTMQSKIQRMQTLEQNLSNLIRDQEAQFKVLEVRDTNSTADFVSWWK